MLIRTLTFRILVGSLSGFLVGALLSFLVLSHILETFLVKRLDRALLTEAVDVGAALEKFPAIEAESVTGELERYGHTHGIATSFFRLYSSDGVLLASSSLEHWPHLNRQWAAPDAEGRLFGWETRAWSARPAGVRSVIFRHPRGFLLQIGLDLGETAGILRLGRWVFGGAMAFIMLVGSIWGWLAVRRSLRGMKDVGGVAAHVTERMDFSCRAPEDTGSEETDRLALAFNTMLDRVQVLIQNQKAVMDNIAHDIRSPVARMRAGAEHLLERSDQAELAGRVIEECDRILNLVNTLLEISATEAGIMRWDLQKVDPALVVRDAAELFAPVIEAKSLELFLKLDPNLRVEADERVFQRVIANLLDNAIKYTGSRGRIVMRLFREGAKMMLVVEDTGEGIPTAELPAIFDRFYRCDASRTKLGSGLGLSFCKAAVNAMDGHVSCTSTLGIGSSFCLSIPLMDDSDEPPVNQARGLPDDP